MRVLTRLNPAVLALLCGLVALALGAYRISRPHVLAGQLGYNLGYDDGVYFGAALRFVHGSAPYRDFVVVHPPGIVYLLAPAAFVGRVFTEHDGLVVARLLTGVVTAANASLAALAVRGRGRVAMAVAGLTMAVWPLAVAADRTVELEPYLVFFCLLGAVTLFDGEQLAVGRRLVWSGIWFGLAMDVKVWAVMPAVAALVVVGWGRRTLHFLGGIAIAVAAVCLPFFVLAPRSFFHDVIAAQLTRDETGVAATPIGERVRLLTGVSGWPGTDRTVVAWVLLGLIVAAVVARFVLGARRPSRLEWFALVGWVVIVGGMFESKTFYDHYAYLPAAWMVLLLGVLAASAAEWLAGRRAGVGRGMTVAAAVAASAVLLFAGVQQVRFSHRYLTEAADPRELIGALVPKGACAFSDFPDDLIIANRYNAADRVCPQVTDPYGLYLAEDGGRTPHLEPPSYRPQFAADWRARLEQYDYVIVRIPYSSFVPFPPSTQEWFAANYTLIAHLSQSYPDGFIDKQKDEYVYKRNAS